VSNATANPVTLLVQLQQAIGVVSYSADYNAGVQKHVFGLQLYKRRIKSVGRNKTTQA